MKSVKCGVVGIGFIGPIHIEALRRLGSVEVIAIASSTQQKAELNARRLHVPRAYGDWRDLVNDDDVQVVHITAPNELHYPIALACIERGKAVVCDKPLTMKSHDSADLVRRARERRVINAVTFNMYYYPMVKQAEAMIRSGEAGDIYFAHGSYLQDWLLSENDYNWRVESRYSGASRVLADIGSHWLQMVQALVGQRISRVFAETRTLVPIRKKPLIPALTFGKVDLKPGEFEEVEVDTEDLGMALFEFETGVPGMVAACQVSPGRKNYINWEIHGSKKTLRWNGEEPNALWVGARYEPNSVLLKDPSLLESSVSGMTGAPGGLAEGYLDTWKAIFRDIYEYVLANEYPEDECAFPTFAEGYRIQTLVESMLVSATEGRWVEVRYDI